MASKCVWCRDENADPIDDGGMCPPHRAEFNGTSLDGLDRMDAAYHADAAALGYYDR